MDVFDRDLEAIFEHRAGDFSSELRQLLRELWLEGVRHGRELERLEGHELGRPAAVITSSATRELRPGEFALEHITKVAAELGALPSRDVRQLEPSFGLGRWLEELESSSRAELSSPWRPSSDIRSSLDDVRHLSRRELFGSWRDEE